METTATTTDTDIRQQPAVDEPATPATPATPVTVELPVSSESCAPPVIPALGLWEMFDQSERQLNDEIRSAGDRVLSSPRSSVWDLGRNRLF